MQVEHRPDFLGGVSVIKGSGLLRRDKEDGLYRRVTKPNWDPFDATFVPYFAWSNRGMAEMTVFVPVVW